MDHITFLITQCIYMVSAKHRVPTGLYEIIQGLVQNFQVIFADDQGQILNGL